MLKKPPKCDQDWLKMQEVEGGRICAQCQKKIHDFRNLSWIEIESIQAENNQSACGIYSKKQLHTWDRPKKRNLASKPAAILSSFLIGGSIIHADALAQNRDAEVVENRTSDVEFQVDTTENKEPEKIEVKGRVYDASQAEALPFVNVLLKDKDKITLEGGATDVLGKFHFKIDRKVILFPCTLEVSSVGYQSTSLVLNKENTNEYFLEIPLSSEDVQITHFYVEEPSRWRRFWWKFKNIFRKKS